MSEPITTEEQETLKHGDLDKIKRLIKAAFRVWELKNLPQEEREVQQ